ncbi:MAG: isoprenyl transferase [Verrucomicrobiota bacterium]
MSEATSTIVSSERDTPLAVPRHVAVIMDGNGRWARERGLPRREGHRAGAESVRTAVESCQKLGIDYLTLYAFSSENWKRPPAETAALMQLLERFLQQKTPELKERNVRLQAIGNLERLPAASRQRLEDSIEQTASNSGLRLILALSYGAREELCHAMQEIARSVEAGRMRPDEIDLETIAAHLYTCDCPDPDLLIRTSGEMRISNFLLWQISYSEIVVTKRLWPDFRESDFQEAVLEYGRRQRRYGGL